MWIKIIVYKTLMYGSHKIPNFYLSSSRTALELVSLNQTNKTCAILQRCFDGMRSISVDLIMLDAKLEPD
jgi:hypothetical protein